MKMTYELAVIAQDGTETKMSIRSYPSRAAAMEVRSALVKGFQRTGYTLTEGTDLVERILLRLDADRVPSMAFVAPSVTRPTIELIVRLAAA